MQFKAIYIEPYTNSTTANVLFADPETDPDQPSVLSFSRPIDFEGGNYYFEINDQSQGMYGGLDSVRMSRNQIEVRLGDTAVTKFDNEDLREVRVEFEIDDLLYQTALETMKRIFAGFDVFQAE